MTWDFALPVIWETEVKNVALWILCTCLSMPVVAAEAPSSATSSATAKQAPTSAPADAAQDPLLAEAAAAAAAPPVQTPGEESFTPTVQISEDLSVSFPVDI